ncbi:MAG TPA: DNA ligase [Gemmataceae bacterium]|jgi:DNA ligase-1|nr:DNA ligase [Gemmataceae bacterium]
MRDLNDGESIEIQGSANRPYALKNTAGVYSCSCPAWRNQSIGIERRTCKHIRLLRGDAAESARLGSALPAKPMAKDGKAPAPQLLLAESWDGVSDPTGCWLSEKLDGVRTYWDGSQFLSRLGNRFHAPNWFVAGLPNTPLDGELWLGRKQFQRTVSIVRRQDQSDLWKELKFVVFDAPTLAKGFESRLQFVDECLEKCPAYAEPHHHFICLGFDHLRSELARLEALGAEGLMLRRPGSHYESGRSETLQKVKTFYDSEARVLAHQEGSGRHKGRLGALLVEMADGTKFAVGSGLSDVERENPPAVGSLISFRYQELSDRGVPRFPTYVGVRAEAAPLLPLLTKGHCTMTTSVTPRTRRFEFCRSNSNKFWVAQLQGNEVFVRFGRIGTSGQTNVKAFASETEAAQHLEKVIGEKIKKGYRETT